MISEVSKIVSPVYMVGGSVRDTIMGKEPKDYDFATPLSPDEVEALIKKAGKRAYNIGKKFGTMGMTIDGKVIEITTFRNESYIPGSRKPQVKFVSDLLEDLSRRDFTINAIAMDESNQLIDPYSGRLDILERRIKCVGLPKDRFREDPLRLLRAARFAAQTGFEIDGLTEATMKKMSPLILSVSRERWSMEMDKLLMCTDPATGLYVLWRTRLMNFMFPELALQWQYEQNSPYHRHPLHKHTVYVVNDAPDDIEVRWAALFHDVAKPFVAVKNPKKDQTHYMDHEALGAHIVQRYARYLAWSNARRDRVVKLVANHARENSPLREADRNSH